MGTPTTAKQLTCKDFSIERLSACKERFRLSKRQPTGWDVGSDVQSLASRRTWRCWIPRCRFRRPPHRVGRQGRGGFSAFVIYFFLSCFDTLQAVVQTVSNKGTTNGVLASAAAVQCLKLSRGDHVVVDSVREDSGSRCLASRDFGWSFAGPRPPRPARRGFKRHAPQSTKCGRTFMDPVFFFCFPFSSSADQGRLALIKVLKD